MPTIEELKDEVLRRGLTMGYDSSMLPPAYPSCSSAKEYYALEKEYFKQYDAFVKASGYNEICMVRAQNCLGKRATRVFPPDEKDVRRAVDQSILACLQCSHIACFPWTKDCNCHVAAA